MQRLSLTSAEIALLMAALPADPRPFIGDSDLVNVDSTVLYRRMEAAREGVLARRLATVREDNSLELAAPVRAMLLALIQPRSGFQLMHAWAGQPAQRAMFSIGLELTVVDRVDEGRWHHLEVLAGPDQIAARAAEIVRASALPSANGSADSAFALPGSIFAPLAEMPPRADIELVALLTAAGVNGPEAEAFLAAGTRPLHQTVFYSLSMDQGAPKSEAAVWFGTPKSSWLLDAATAKTVRLRRATAATVRQALGEIVAHAAP